MRAAVLRSPRVLSVEEVGEPACPEGGAIIKVTACAVCPTDIKMVRVGQRDLSYPRVLGHEVVGIVDSSSSPNLQEGDAIQVWPGIACGSCPACRKGQDNMCAHQGIIGFNRDGGFAERMAVPAETLARGGVNMVPGGMDAAVASLTEPLACCVHGQNAASVAPGDLVAIFGAGPMGLMHASLARARGAAALVVEPDGDRRRLAVRMGAERAIGTDEPPCEAIMEWSGGQGADVAMLATPKVRPDDDMLRAMAPRGRICLFSGLPRDDPRALLDINQLHYRELSMVGAYGCTSGSNAEAFRLLAEGSVDLRPLISRRMPLGAIDEAFMMIEERRALKCVIDDLTR
ncbi:MAG: alcohol dehydrogenase catalytic domain-containing protein [Methanomassiliicoccus sp.]|nr:alcohol dehydrogenase catalytic domain-containing protein [Methanomassiliicoccus sp.]